jgi:hypothetical protein
VNCVEDTTEAMILYRSIFPRSRVVDRFRFHLNTGCRKSMQCVFCLEAGPSWSAKWPKTMKARQWEAEHSCNPHEGVLKQAFEAYG